MLSNVKDGWRHGRSGGEKVHDDCLAVVDGDVVLDCPGYQFVKDVL